LAHLEDCADCRRAQERLAVLLDPGSALPREIQPSRDLWPAIAGRLDEAEERKPLRLSKFLPLAAAAAIATVAVTSLFPVPPNEDANLATAPIRALETAATAAISGPLPAARVEAGFVLTRVALLKLVNLRKNTMGPEQIAVLEQTLASMESAVQTLHSALKRDPYNPSLLFKLSDTRRRELRYMRQTIS
jgi:hypothetical protein